MKFNEICGRIMAWCQQNKEKKEGYGNIADQRSAMFPGLVQSGIVWMDFERRTKGVGG